MTLGAASAFNLRHGSKNDPNRRYKPIRPGIHVCATDDSTGEPVTVCNYDLPSPELARLRFDAARRACKLPTGDGEVTVELISGGSSLTAFPRAAPRCRT